MLFAPANALLAILNIGLLVITAWAAIDAATRPAAAFVAAGKLTKPAWVAITVLALVTSMYFGIFGMLGLAGIIASIVYLVDVRPAVREVQGGGSRW